MRFEEDSNQIWNTAGYYCRGINWTDFSVNFHKSPTQKSNRIKKCLIQVDRELKEIAAWIGIEPDLSTYAAKHTYAMSLKRGGVGLGLISDALGHVDSKVTRHYLSSFEDEMIDETDSIL